MGEAMLRGEVKRRVQLWAVALVLTMVGMAAAVGVFVLAVSYGAPALSATAIAFGVGTLVAAVIGGAIRWLTEG